MGAVTEEDDYWDFEGAAGLEEVERVSVKRWFWNLWKFYRSKRRKVPVTVAKAEESADVLMKQVGGSGALTENDVVAVTLSAVEAEVVSLSAILMKYCEEALSTKAEVDALWPLAELATKGHEAPFAKAGKERHYNVE